MATLDDDFAFVAASAERANRRQREACQHVLSDPTSPGGGLARHLDLAYEVFELHIAERRAAYANVLDDTMRTDAIVEMRQLLWKMRELQSNLDWLTAAQSPPLDLGTRYFVEDAARRLVAPRVELTVVPQAKASYATTSNPWEPLINGWGGGIPKSEPTIVVVFLPAREETAGLLHPLIMHELGHAADSQHKIVEGIWNGAQERKVLSGRFSAAAKLWQEHSGLDALGAKEHVAGRLMSWIAEAFCDSVAVHLLGPSYLYSFLVEVVAGSLDDVAPNHPPPRQRVRHLLDDLDRLGWNPLMGESDPVLDGWVRSWAGVKPEYGGVEKFLYWAIDDLHAMIRKATKEALAGRFFRPQPAEFAEVSELLAARIPPAQLRSGAPVSRESIILACWYAALEAGGGGPTALPDASEGPELAELLPAALESSALAAAWQPAP
jgi:hypothetical protein